MIIYLLLVECSNYEICHYLQSKIHIHLNIVILVIINLNIIVLHNHYYLIRCQMMFLQ